MVKKNEPTLFSFDDLPKKYISAPVKDQYQEDLHEMYFRKRAKADFESRKMNPASEKFFRLYFYQGLSQADRAFLHQEYLETHVRRYMCTLIVMATSVATYSLLGRTSKYQPFRMIRLGFGAAAGYLSYFFYKDYSVRILEKSVDPFYEKYAIR
jgi:hypothetical protein